MKPGHAWRALVASCGGDLRRAARLYRRAAVRRLRFLLKKKEPPVSDLAEAPATMVVGGGSRCATLEASASSRAKPGGVRHPASPSSAPPWSHLAALCRRRGRAYRLPIAAERVLDVDDVAQELCAHLVRAWPSYDPERGSVAAWASGHIRRALADLSRFWNREQRGKAPMSIDAPICGGPDGDEDATYIADPNARDPVEAAALAETVERARLSLTPREWTIVVARFGGRTLEEAARVEARRSRRAPLHRHEIRRIENAALRTLETRFAQ